MATEPESYNCDLSGRNFLSRSDVRGGLSLDTGTDLFVWGDVSPRAAQEVLAFINDKFPKNQPIVRRAVHPALTEQRVLNCKDRNCGRCIRCAQDEDDAVEAAA